MVPVIQWFQLFNGSSYSIVPVIQWSQFNGSSYSMVPLYIAFNFVCFFVFLFGLDNK